MQSQSGRCQTSETTDLVLLWKTAGLPSGSYVRDPEAAVARGFREVRGSRGFGRNGPAGGTVNWGMLWE